MLFASFESLVNSFFEFLFGDSSLTIYRLLALGGTLFFVVIMLFSLIGGVGDADTDTDVDTDVDADMGDIDGDGEIDVHPDNGISDMKLFSVRSIFAFLAMFGWGGVISKEHGIVSFLVACVCGFAAMFIVAFVVKMLLKLQQNGARSNKSLIGAKGKVYLEIPGGDKHGKVTLNLKDSTREVIAKSNLPIARGVDVVVIGLEGDVFQVKRID